MKVAGLLPGDVAVVLGASAQCGRGSRLGNCVKPDHLRDLFGEVDSLVQVKSPPGSLDDQLVLANAGDFNAAASKQLPHLLRR